MKKYSEQDIKKAIEAGKDKTDWNALDRMSEQELEKNILDDPDEGPESLISPKVIQWYEDNNIDLAATANALLEKYMSEHSEQQ